MTPTSTSSPSALTVPCWGPARTTVWCECGTRRPASDDKASRGNRVRRGVWRSAPMAPSWRPRRGMKGSSGCGTSSPETWSARPGPSPPRSQHPSAPMAVNWPSRASTPSRSSWTSALARRSSHSRGTFRAQSTLTGARTAAGSRRPASMGPFGSSTREPDVRSPRCTATGERSSPPTGARTRDGS